MKIGIVVAMQKELNHLLELAGECIANEIFGNTVYTFENYPDIYVILSGVGEIQSAMACSILLSTYKVDRVINFGYVGALCADLEKGEIVNIESVIHCDMDLTIFGKKPGQYDELTTVEFAADYGFFDHLELDRKKLSSSDSFLDPGEERDNLMELFGKNVTDMEGAGIAVVCTKANVPFSMIKCVSNAVDDTHEDYSEFSAEGIKYCAELVYKTVFAID
ncbi:MAG: 5'-methylthioadenosine/S-adenosylhomocysteine nucleosidase [Clostridia bacterium]|nr:5'-methylthioadenosine/S-adenosylhomocysteine nucleosidase [Clostridia bacterium]